MIEVKDIYAKLYSLYAPCVIQFFPLENNVYMKLKLISLKFQNKELKRKCIQIHLIISFLKLHAHVFSFQM